MSPRCRPGVWDVLYYAETLKYAKSKQKPAGVFVLASDIALAMFEEVGSAFADFANNQQGWNNAYAKA